MYGVSRSSVIEKCVTDGHMLLSPNMRLEFKVISSGSGLKLQLLLCTKRYEIHNMISKQIVQQHVCSQHVGVRSATCCQRVVGYWEH